MNVKVDLTGLTILFIVLKILNVIHWSWFWVLSPALLPFIIITLFFFLLLVGAITRNEF